MSINVLISELQARASAKQDRADNAIDRNDREGAAYNIGYVDALEYVVSRLEAYREVEVPEAERLRREMQDIKDFLKSVAHNINAFAG